MTCTQNLTPTFVCSANKFAAELEAELHSGSTSGLLAALSCPLCCFLSFPASDFRGNEWGWWRRGGLESRAPHWSQRLPQDLYSSSSYSRWQNPCGPLFFGGEWWPDWGLWNPDMATSYLQGSAYVVSHSHQQSEDNNSSYFLEMLSEFPWLLAPNKCAISANR